MNIAMIVLTQVVHENLKKSLSLFNRQNFKYSENLNSLLSVEALKTGKKGIQKYIFSVKYSYKEKI